MIDQGVGGSIDNRSNTFIASLIDKRNLCCFRSFDKAYVGFDEIGFDLESSEVADVERLQKPPGSTSRNRQSTNKTTEAGFTGNFSPRNFSPRFIEMP